MRVWNGACTCKLLNVKKYILKSIANILVIVCAESRNRADSLSENVTNTIPTNVTSTAYKF